MANFEFKESFDNFLKLRKALKFLKNNPVYVGIPEDTTERKEEGNEEKVQ